MKGAKFIVRAIDRDYNARQLRSVSFQLVRCDMKSNLASFPQSMLTIFICTLALAFVSVSSVRAQQPASERDIALRERQLRGIGKVNRVEDDIARPRLTLGQVKEDYEGLQAANNRILKMLSASAGSVLDYKLIDESASEIKKRAGRLKSYLLVLQMMKEDETRRKNLSEIGTEEIKDSLLSLDKIIVRLVDNPIFRNFDKVLDAEGSKKASDDLDDIIELSEGIKRSARRAVKLSRAAR
jgi:hypothetical protein